MPEGYCVKERKKVEIKDAKQVTMKNGRPAMQGFVPRLRHEDLQDRETLTPGSRSCRIPVPVSGRRRALPGAMRLSLNPAAGPATSSGPAWTRFPTSRSI